MVYAEPRYSNNNKITLSITFSENEAVCYAKIKGDTGTTSITNCTISLKDSNGNEVKSWSNLSSKSSMLVCSKTTSNITKGETIKRICLCKPQRFKRIRFRFSFQKILKIIKIIALPIMFRTTFSANMTATLYERKNSL